MTQGQAVDKETVHVSGWTDWDGARLHHAPPHDMRLKTCESFTSGSFRLIILDRGRPRMPESTGTETEAKWGQLSTMAPEPRLETRRVPTAAKNGGRFGDFNVRTEPPGVSARTLPCTAWAVRGAGEETSGVGRPGAPRA